MNQKNKLASSLGAFLRVLFDLMVLNILWLICSLPVVTIGASSSALCSVSLKLARGEPVATFQSFFEALKRNLVQALLLGLIGLAGLSVAAVDWVFALAQEGSLRKLYFVVGVIEPGKTLLIWIAFAVPVLCFLFLPEAAVIYIGWAYILFAVSAPAYLAARQQVKVFARFGGPAARIDPQEDNFYQ